MAGAGMHPYHQPWTPSPAPVMAPEAHHMSVNTQDEVRTIFISGLPDDVKERELQNLCRWLPGYEASQVNYKGEQPMGFVLFSTAPMAMAARDALQELVFDAEAKSVLRTEMAKKNLFIKRGVVGDSNSFDQSKRMRTGGDYNPAAYPHPPSYPPATPPAWGPQGYMPPSAPYDPYVPPYVSASSAPAPTPTPAAYAPVQNMKDNPPCNTLFIGNLGENIVEEELRGLFAGQPGYKQMKVLRQERNTVCFIEFYDVNSAMAVHRSLQGAVLPSSGRGGMRIQFSKNPFGKRKDGANGTPDANGTPAYQ
ncbi:RNA-binding protein with multiple splicing 2 isoform X2 [Amborella trichopoda]|nr:RNA-binding protein with multiple splicing 2 isoform X2 [Amborella trichopoda]|eukprot:XP_020523689.1 RNA-binding protein with multiple splicing 2 isoform X2 [Amborella trichopoda]